MVQVTAAEKLHAAVVAAHPIVGALDVRHVESENFPGRVEGIKRTLREIPLDDVIVVDGANPREDYSDIGTLVADIAANGQLEPAKLYSAKGDALLYINRFPARTNKGPIKGGKITEETHFLARGHRRFRALVEARKQYLAAYPDKKETPFDVLRVEIAEKPCVSKLDIANAYGDQSARANASTRYEMAKFANMYREAGLTQNEIAAKLAVSRGKVQVLLRVWDLPNNETYPILDAVRRYDLRKAEIAHGLPNKDGEAMAGVIEFSDSLVNRLDRAHRWSLAPWNLGKREETPENFAELWAHVVATLGKEPADTSNAAIARKTVTDLLARVSGKFRKGANEPASLVLRVLLGTADAKELTTFEADSEVKAEAAKGHKTHEK